MFSYDPTANIDSGVPQLWALLGWLQHAWELRFNEELIITSLADGKHGETSDHYRAVCARACGWTVFYKVPPPSALGWKCPNCGGCVIWGFAADVRTRHFYELAGPPWDPVKHPIHAHPASVEQLARTVQKRLGPRGARVVLHPDWDKPGEEKPPHLHLAWRLLEGNVWLKEAPA